MNLENRDVFLGFARFWQLLVFLLVVSIALPADSEPNKANSNGKLNDLLSNVLEAYGGARNIETFYSTPLGLSGKFIDSKKQIFDENYEAVNDKWSVTFTDRARDFESKQWFDGKKHWSKVNRTVYCYSDSEEPDQNKRNYIVYHVLKLMVESSKNIEKFELAPSKVIDGTPCEGLIFVCPPLNTRLSLWAGKSDHLIRCIKYSQKSSKQDSDCDIVQYYSNYSRISGFQIAFKVTTFFGNSFISQTKWDKAQIPISLDETFVPRANNSDTLGNVIVPFEARGDGQIIVYGKANGNVANIKLDTGSRFTLVNGIYANSIGLRSKAKVNHMDALFSKTPYRDGVLAELTIGDLRLKNLFVKLGASKHQSYAILLGMDVLRNFILIVDFASNTVAFSKKGDETYARNSLIIPMHLLGVPYLEGKINGNIQASFMLDSGAPDVPVIMTLSPATACSEISNNDDSPIRDTNGTLITAQHGRLRSLELGELKWTNSDVRFLAPGKKIRISQNLIGLQSLRNYKTVILDFPGERLICLPYPEIIPTITK